MRKSSSDKIRQKVIETYSEIADEFDQTRQNPWLEFLHFMEYVDTNSKVLDLACGNGRLYDLLKEKKVDYLGIDNNAKLLEKAKKNFPEATFQIGDMVDLDLPDNTYDAILCIAAFHHIPGRKLRQKSADEMHRILKKNGVVILTAWNLFQWKYIKNFFKSIGSTIIHLGFKNAWNDLWIKWGKSGHNRYYHAFLPNEFKKYFKKGWKIEEFYFVRKGSRVKFQRSFNICLIATKK